MEEISMLQSLPSCRLACKQLSCQVRKKWFSSHDLCQPSPTSRGVSKVPPATTFLPDIGGGGRWSLWRWRLAHQRRTKRRHLPEERGQIKERVITYLWRHSRHMAGLIHENCQLPSFDVPLDICNFGTRSKFRLFPLECPLIGISTRVRDTSKST